MLAGELVNRGYLPSGFPYSALKDVPQDIIDIVEGRITKIGLEKKLAQWYSSGRIIKK